MQCTRYEWGGMATPLQFVAPPPVCWDRFGGATLSGTQSRSIRGSPKRGPKSEARGAFRIYLTGLGLEPALALHFYCNGTELVFRWSCTCTTLWLKYIVHLYSNRNAPMLYLCKMGTVRLLQGCWTGTANSFFTGTAPVLLRLAWRWYITGASLVLHWCCAGVEIILYSSYTRDALVPSEMGGRGWDLDMVDATGAKT